MKRKYIKPFIENVISPNKNLDLKVHSFKSEKKFLDESNFLENKNENKKQFELDCLKKIKTSSFCKCPICENSENQSEK